MFAACFVHVGLDFGLCIIAVGLYNRLCVSFVCMGRDEGIRGMGVISLGKVIPCVRVCVCFCSIDRADRLSIEDTSVSVRLNKEGAFCHSTGRRAELR